MFQMAYQLTKKEIQQILKESVFIDSNIADICADYLMDAFKKIDNKFTSPNLNKGRKGEVLLGCITDITLNRFNYSLVNDYTIQPGFGANKITKQGGIDYRVDLQGQIFLLESKNLSTTKIDRIYYEDHIKDRFKYQGLNFLFITEKKINDVLRYSKPDKLDIYFIPLPFFMDINKNIRKNIKDNILHGIEIFTTHLNDILNKMYNNNPFTINQCVKLGMATWFIKNYLPTSDRTINRTAKSLGIDRRSKKWKADTFYREVLRK